jgi:PKHD-type hydroxylase
MIFDPHFWLFDSVLSDGLCDLIIERGNEMNKELGVAGGEVVLDMRKSHIAWFDHNDWIAGLCHHYATLANKQAWNFDIDNMDGCQFTEYGVDEFYEAHMDTHKLCDDMRKVSVVMQLNSKEDYQGGEFLFVDGDEGYEPDNFANRGSVIVFPSFLYHQVKPVTGGKRHSIVSWFTGPQIK